MRYLPAILVLLGTFGLRAENKLPPQLEGVGVDEKLGAHINLDLQFTAENGYQVPLRQYFAKGKPVLLTFVYYNCPMLCNLVLNAQTQAMRELAWTPGDDYEVVTVSIDPRENWGLAAKKKQLYLENYGKPVHDGWHFLADHNDNVKQLAAQVGFRYRYDGKIEQYAHSAVLLFLTPDGRVSRYLYGIKFRERDMRLALTEASEGKLGSTIDKLLLFCYHYDPASRSYVPMARNIMRLGGALTVAIVAFVLMGFWRRERSRARISSDSLVTAK